MANPVRRLQDQLTEAAGLTGTASRTVQLLPAMLGADSQRRYLLMFQNNAEVRATGGIPGAVAVVTADRGGSSSWNKAPPATSAASTGLCCR